MVLVAVDRRYEDMYEAVDQYKVVKVVQRPDVGMLGMTDALDPTRAFTTQTVESP